MVSKITTGNHSNIDLPHNQSNTYPPPYTGVLSPYNTLIVRYNLIKWLNNAMDWKYRVQWGNGLNKFDKFLFNIDFLHCAGVETHLNCQSLISKTNSYSIGEYVCM